MCGIVGYVGNKCAAPILINGLHALEYRGYDSAGIALLNDDIQIFKEKGRVKNILDDNNIDNESTIGIAHTGWATHGTPSKTNAHPHLDNSKIFAVVHNGIIENYLELKELLINNGYHFDSDTDTEVIPNLIHYYYNQENDVYKAFKKAINDLKGSYAILLLSPLLDGVLATKLASPLVIGKGIQENFIASDIPAILEYTKDFYFLEDYEFAFISSNNIKFYNKDFIEIKKHIKVIEWDKNSANKNGFEDYMLKEIFEQPTAIKETLAGRISLNERTNFIDLDISEDYLKNVNKIYIVACGTAMHAGKVGKIAIESLTNILTTVEVASEFRYNNPIIDKNTLCISISQSGETADTIAALKLAKNKGAKTIAISNVIGSSITREAHYTIYTHAGPEIAVASTKAYIAQVVTVVALAVYLAEILETVNVDQINDLKMTLISLPDKVDLILKDITPYQNLAKEMNQVSNCFYIGRGNDYNIALEGSLKLKEITYIHSEAYPAGELKHGPIALIENGTYVIGIITNESIAEKTLSNLEEVITRGAKVILITNQNLGNRNMTIFNVPNVNILLSPVVAMIPLQLLAYFIAKEKNLDVDKPRNLAKSVTVE